jgi:YesN/AraC family two-component response regulator
MLNVDLLSARIDRHRVTAGRIFRKRYGITISDYLMQVRHKEALNLIINTDISPEQLPELCGFSSKTYFYQVIKKITGKTPETLRRTEKIKRLTETS